MDIRCPSKKHGELIEPGVIEVSCNSAFCGRAPGVIVLHRYDVTGETPVLVKTWKFREPERK